VLDNRMGLSGLKKSRLHFRAGGSSGFPGASRGAAGGAGTSREGGYISACFFVFLKKTVVRKQPAVGWRQQLIIHHS
jgi:hypothetical protein